MKVETRWGNVQDVNSYVLHVFDPKPWHPSSGFYLEWLSNLHKAQRMHIGDPPSIDRRAMLDIRQTAKRIRLRQLIYRLTEVLGPAKVPTMELLYGLYWRCAAAKAGARRLIGVIIGRLSA